MQRKIDQLLADLKQACPEVDGASLINQKQLQETMNKLCPIGSRFDEDILAQLLERLNEKQADHQINTLSWKNFVVVYIEAEDLLKQKAANAKKVLEDFYLKRNEVDTKLQEARQTEVLNQYGVAFNSQLTVGVKAISMNVSPSVQPYVQVQLGANQSHQTANAFGNKATFNNTFHFTVSTGQESLQVNVMNYDRASQDTLLGSVTIPLTLLKDQYPRENAYALQGFDRSEIGIVTLSLQWLHSQEKYLSETLMQWEEHIRLQEEDLIGFEQDLVSLYLPFPNYVRLFRTDLGQPQQQQSSNALLSNQQAGVVQQQQISPEYQKIDLRGVALQDVIQVDKQLFNMTLILLGIFFSLTLLSLMYRPQFLDWMICLAAFLYYWLHIFDHKRTWQIFVFLVIAIVLDFFWLFAYSSGWWQVYADSPNNQGTEGSTETPTTTVPENTENNIFIIDRTLRKYSICISYIAFFAKFPLAIALYLLQKELESQLKGKTVVKEKLQSTLNFNRSPEYAATQQPFSNPIVPPQNYINRQYISSDFKPIVGVPQGAQPVGGVALPGQNAVSQYRPNF